MQRKRDEAIAECINTLLGQILETMFNDFPKVFVYTALEMLGLVEDSDGVNKIKNENFGKNFEREDLQKLSPEDLAILRSSGVQIPDLTTSEVETFKT